MDLTLRSMGDRLRKLGHHKMPPGVTSIISRRMLEIHPSPVGAPSSVLFPPHPPLSVLIPNSLDTHNSTVISGVFLSPRAGCDSESSLLSELMHEGYQPYLSPIPAEDGVGASGALASAPSGRDSLMQKDHTVQNLGLNLQMQPGINSTHPGTTLISQGSLSLENHSDTLTKNSSYLQGYSQDEPSGGNKSSQQNWVT